MEKKRSAPALSWIRKKSAQGDYQISEHVMRSLLSGQVSLTQIQHAVSNGSVIEIHRNPKRSDSLLLLGFSDGTPVHVRCADAGDGQLRVLFAYAPSRPLWDTPQKRAKTGGIPMEKLMGTCFFCGGEIESITIGNFDYRLEGQLYVIKDVPAGLCKQCGEKYVSADAAKKIASRIDAGDFQGTEEVRVLSYK